MSGDHRDVGDSISRAAQNRCASTCHPERAAALAENEGPKLAKPTLQPSACVLQPDAHPPLTFCCKQRLKCTSTALSQGCRSRFSPFFGGPISSNSSSQPPLAIC